MLDVIQIFSAILIIVLVLFQQRGAEGGVLFGTKTEFFFKRRGLEKTLFYLTWIFILIFVLVSLLKIV